MTSATETQLRAAEPPPAPPEDTATAPRWSLRKHGTAVKGGDYSGSTNSDTGSGSGSSAQSSQSTVYRLDPSDVS